MTTWGTRGASAASGWTAALTGLGLILGAGCALFGCNSSSRSQPTHIGQGSTTTTPPPGFQVVLPPQQRTIGAHPVKLRTIEESDLAKLDGTFLYVQNPHKGLTIINVADPDAPTIHAQLTHVVGTGGEVYVKNGHTAFVVLEESSLVAGQAEIAAVESTTAVPQWVGTLNLPGKLVASRLVGDLIYAVTRDELNGAPQTWVFSVNVADPRQMFIADQRMFAGDGHEVHVTSSAIYVSQKVISGTHIGQIEIRYVDISDPGGAILERGSIRLDGTLRSRFHLHAVGNQLRVVTFLWLRDGSSLYVIDTSDPDALRLQGELRGFAKNEDLHATRFVGDRAYVVTYEPPRGTDPLWVISLDDPSRPRVLGTLEVPGWSEYVFPRSNDTLVAVGRGDDGRQVATSLFDVADPTQPRLLKRLTFGVDNATSEGNTDFRGVAIVDSGSLAAPTPLIAVPYTNNLHVNGACQPEHHVQLIDLKPDDLELRGDVAEVGLVRRALPIGSKLYAVTDKTVAAVDVSNRDAPFNARSLEVGDLTVPETCSPVFRNLEGGGGGHGCGLTSPAAGGTPLPALLLLALLGLLRRSKRA